MREGEQNRAASTPRPQSDSVSGDRRNSQNVTALGIHVQAREALGLPIEHGAIDLGERHREHLQLETALARLLLVEADVGDLRIGVRGPRNDERALPPSIRVVMLGPVPKFGDQEFARGLVRWLRL